MTEVRRVLFLGSKALGYRILREIHALSPQTLIGIMTVDDSSDSRSVFGAIKQYAQHAGLPLYVATGRKDSERILRETAPELCLVSGWYWLIGRDVLEQIPRGFIGFHPSLLPKLRGGSPLVWSVIAGMKETGITLFSFSDGMDEGPIWAQEPVEIRAEDYIADVLARIEFTSASMIREYYPSILRGSIQPREQRHDEATYCSQRLPEDGLIDWTDPASVVYDFIRAQSNPYPGAFTFMGSTLLRVRRADIFDATYYGIPGQVARIGSDGVYVVCGRNTCLVVRQLDLNGKICEASHIVTSIRTRLGASKQP